MAASMIQEQQKGPPYPPHVAQTGGIPTILPDVPATAVFIAIYLSFAVTNIIIFRKNLARGHKFIPSALLTGFSMARVLTCCLRIGWATNHQNVSLAIAAGIFTNVGIIIVFILNLIFAQRILRAKSPQVGWHKSVHYFFLALYFGLVVAIVNVVTLTVMTFYSLDRKTLEDAEWIQRGASLYILILCVLPLLIVGLAYVLPHTHDEEPFGHGSIDMKALILMIGACLCTIIEGFKTGVGWSPPRPASEPAWYDGKAAFYCFNFSLEILILILYTAVGRVDLRFYVPDRSSRRKTYIVQEEERKGSIETADTSPTDARKETDSSLKV